MPKVFTGAYYSNSSNNVLVFNNKWHPSSPSTWVDQKYRTITFLEPPTGDLLKWLQANAVKQ